MDLIVERDLIRVKGNTKREKSFLFFFFGKMRTTNWETFCDQSQIPC